MKSAYFRELQRYTKSEISNALDATEEISDLLRKLKLVGILKSVKPAVEKMNLFELDFEEVVISDVESEDPGQLFVFDFVGIVSINNYLIKCFPKYISHDDRLLGSMQKILKALQKYNYQEQFIDISHGAENRDQFNMLSVILYLIDDYHTNGVYTNQKEIFEIMGDGEIDWDTTINETYPIIKNNRPHYLNYFSHASVDDDQDYFRRLHECVISDCSRLLNETELNSLFQIDEQYPYQGNISDFGNEDYILFSLNKELSTQFITRKQLLLKTISVYISRRKSFRDGSGLCLYGTSNFNLVWEKVCRDVFGDLLSDRLYELPIKLKPPFKDRENDRLIELIEKPIWKALVNEEYISNIASDTLIPDIVGMYSNDTSLCFGIFDAKYYRIKLDESGVRDQPGISDITKQYLYQLVFSCFIETHDFGKVINAFLFPGDEDDSVVLGEVELPVLRDLKDPALTNILAVKLPSNKMYDWYISGEKVDIYRDIPCIVG
ncbi:LlaJI family restriction endonuclease [Chloroflexota bacterium]